MHEVQVRSCDGVLINMIAVEESEKLIYVVSPSSVDRLESGLTEPVGVPKKDVIYQRDI